MNPYPCLNGTGWCTDPELAILAILSNYCNCEFSATKLYRKRIRSLPYRLMVYTDEMSLASIVEEDLLHIYKNAFDGVESTVSYNPDEQYDLGSESPRFHLEVSLIINDGNQRYTLSKILNIDNKTVVMVSETLR